jgi:hypothetical protein
VTRLELLRRITERWGGGYAVDDTTMVTVPMLAAILEDVGVLEPVHEPKCIVVNSFKAQPGCLCGCRLLDDPDSEYHGCACEGACGLCHRG